MSDLVAEFLKRIDKAQDVNLLVQEMQGEITRLRGDAEVARLRLEAARGGIEKLQHRVRFQDSVIRSGDVATLTDAEREAASVAFGIMNERAAKLQDRPDTREAARPFIKWARALQGLFERLGGER